MQMDYNYAFDILQDTHPFPHGTSISKKEKVFPVKLDLSIIIPAYNVSGYIEKCIESLISQNTKFSYEIIVVNDGSTDDTLCRVSKYRSNKLIKIINKSNNGVSSARNSGLEISRGEYISFVDADDYVTPDFVETLIELAKRKDADIVQGAYSVFNKQRRRKNVSSEKVKKVNPFTSLYGYPWGKVYKAYLFNDAIFPVNFWFEDTMIMYRCYPKAKKVYSTSKKIYCYRLNPTGQTSSSVKNKKSLESLYITIQLLFDCKKMNKDRRLTSDIYDFTLSQMVMNFNRIAFLDEQKLYAAFTVMCKIIEDFFPLSIFKTSNSNLKLLEKSLRKRDYALFIAACLDN
ncbi:glycosyltransferase family 2 protein [Limosilactobacillus vaginalis]|uniref:glycosyltransferase family 2 protein n=1 Tax=Limosilactobacillus vaginalis TaxID=1633 RepID=UPI0022E89945|nr:glycosyltransferase family 2 protein [Limosilactobacillus vaginalis]